ncbi:hypothetical protein GFS60_04438 [Rhodococcus sp. WAY2]|nr:hypothetical protein GFS60_04438 [Rhodococcus sp. WAY2]
MIAWHSSSENRYRRSTLQVLARPKVEKVLDPRRPSSA